jgi:anti-sigma regulatory factor (Ser/Thr protein kinase)
VRLVHEALYYSDLDEFLTGTLAFIAEGFRAREAVLVAVPEPRLSTLRDAVTACQATIRCGNPGPGATYVDMAEAGRNPNRIIPWVLRAFTNGHAGRVRVIVEPVFVGRPPDEVPPCVQHEALVNVAFAEEDMNILCPYDVRQLSHIVPYAERTHPMVRATGSRRPSTSYTDPYTVLALLNQPLPKQRRVDEAVVFDITGLGGLRQRVGTYADQAGMPADRVADLQLAVTEIGTNAVVHAGHIATLRIWRERDRVICEIRGAGEISDIMAGRVVPAPDSPRGRGLLIANRLCDLVQTHTAPTGTTTRLHMRVSPSPADIPEPTGLDRPFA